MHGQTCTDRQIIAVTGPDRGDFLQGLITNDVEKARNGLIYAALLTPQGKYLADFFLIETGSETLLDVKSDLAPALLQRLSMYKLRADVTLTPTDMQVHRGTGTPPPNAQADPRHPTLGWRLYGTAQPESDNTDWDALRVAECVPESGIELIPNESFILEAGFERLHGVDFKKGCYVGQEVTARMKHKTELRKGLVTVAIDGAVPTGTDITSDGKVAGVILTQSGNRAIAYLRFDRAGGTMTADNATIVLDS